MERDAPIRPLQVGREVHKEIANRCRWHEIKMKDLATAMLHKMFTDHKDEIEEIIKDLKMKKK